MNRFETFNKTLINALILHNCLPSENHIQIKDLGSNRYEYKIILANGKTTYIYIYIVRIGAPSSYKVIGTKSKKKILFDEELLQSEVPKAGERFLNSLYFDLDCSYGFIMYRIIANVQVELNKNTINIVNFSHDVNTIINHLYPKGKKSLIEKKSPFSYKYNEEDKITAITEGRIAKHKVAEDQSGYGVYYKIEFNEKRFKIKFTYSRKKHLGRKVIYEVDKSIFKDFDLYFNEGVAIINKLSKKKKLMPLKSKIVKDINNEKLTLLKTQSIISMCKVFRNYMRDLDTINYSELKKIMEDYKLSVKKFNDNLEFITASTHSVKDAALKLTYQKNLDLIRGLHEDFINNYNKLHSYFLVKSKEHYSLNTSSEIIFL